MSRLEGNYETLGAKQGVGGEKLKSRWWQAKKSWRPLKKSCGQTEKSSETKLITVSGSKSSFALPNSSNAGKTMSVDTSARQKRMQVKVEIPHLGWSQTNCGQCALATARYLQQKWTSEERRCLLHTRNTAVGTIGLCQVPRGGRPSRVGRSRPIRDRRRRPFLLRSQPTRPRRIHSFI